MLYPVDQPVLRRAHGRRRRRRLRARHAGAGLGHRPALPAALQADAVGGERRRIHALCAVGPGAEGRPRHPHRRRMHPRAVARRHDHPHRAAGGALSCGDDELFRRADDSASTAKWCEGTAPQFVAGQARRARRAPCQGRRSPAISSSPTSRTARAACATCKRCSGSPNTSTASSAPRDLVEPGVFDQDESRALPPLRGLPLGGALPHALPHRPGRGAAAPSTCSARSPSGSATPAIAACPAVERFMKHYFLVAKDVGDLTAHLLRGAGGRSRPSRAPSWTASSAASAGAASATRRHQRFRRRQRPHQRRRRRGVRARSGQPDPAVLARRPARTGPFHPDATAAGHALAAADRRRRCGATRRPTGCSSTS